MIAVTQWLRIWVFKVIPISGLPCRRDNKSAFLMQIIIHSSMTVISFAPNLVCDFATICS